MATRTDGTDLNRWNIGAGLYRWSWGMEAPIHWILPDDPLGDAFSRKRIRGIILHGEGTASARIFVDGRLVTEGTLVSTQRPDRPRRLNLPRGSTGYVISVELWGQFRMDQLHIEYDALPKVER